VITIDGPVAAGKTTVARLLAERLGLTLLDTGAIYRCVALASHRQGVSWEDELEVARIAAALNVRFQVEGEVNRVLLDNEEVTEAIRSPEMSQGASIVSALPAVRAALLDLQRDVASGADVIAEGRDTGTVVFPGAEVKVFLQASPEVRARRRRRELQTKGIDEDLSVVLMSLNDRDARDSNRPVAPLTPAADAILIDATDKSAQEVVTEILDHVRMHANDKP